MTDAGLQTEADAAAEILRAYRGRINTIPAIIPLLYDADLLPEQIVTVRGAISMAAVVDAYESGRKDGEGLG
jgi:hypothetical protein